MSLLSKSRCLLQLHRTFLQRTVYSGPYSTPDFTKIEEEDQQQIWEIKKMRNIRQRVIDINQGITHSGNDRIVDEEQRRVHTLPHLIYESNPEKYRVKGDRSKHVIGRSTPEKVKDEVETTNIDPDFEKPGVQEILIKLRGFNLDKVYRKLHAKYKEMPRVRLLTEQQLKEEFEAATNQAEELLAMPPVMTERKPIDEILSDDELLDGYEHCNIVFTDISEDLSRNERFIVVREPSGSLRKATWDERDRILQTYFPKPGRTIAKPELFNDLQIAFENHLHENVLEQLLAQHEPNAAAFIEVSQQVYDDIDKNKLFESLRSTRFFGGLAFFLTKHRSIDNLLLYYLEKRLISEASELVRLFTILKPESKTAKNSSIHSDDIQKIEVYISFDAHNTVELKSAVKDCERFLNERSDATGS